MLDNFFLHLTAKFTLRSETRGRKNGRSARCSAWSKDVGPGPWTARAQICVAPPIVLYFIPGFFRDIFLSKNFPKEADMDILTW